MDNVEPCPGVKDYQDFLVAFGVSGVYSITLALWLIFGREKYLLLWMLNFWLLTLLKEMVQAFIDTELKVYVRYTSSNIKYFDDMMLVLAATCVSIGTIGIFFRIFVDLMKDRSDVSDMLSNRILRVILNNSSVFLLNGSVVFCYLSVKEESLVLKINGFLLLGGIGLVSMICFVARLVEPWQAYRRSRRNRVLVRPVRSLI
ncbi:hypothetical protein HanXRQr2_Chr12g0560331 [Helianthus annuus]|uniref:Uncharacterized protein n=1 Tax=Helianthus annuus TaxID=4232 RepID=A0A251T3S5_HELAN|nr:hypothetical protein HanXRQr2_Chr12g0560331 [Helianthus annuus]